MLGSHIDDVIHVVPVTINALTVDVLEVPAVNVLHLTIDVIGRYTINGLYLYDVVASLSA